MEPRPLDLCFAKGIAIAAGVGTAWVLEVLGTFSAPGVLAACASALSILAVADLVGSLAAVLIRYWHAYQARRR